MRILLAPALQHRAFLVKRLKSFIQNHLRGHPDSPLPFQSSRTSAAFQLEIPEISGTIFIKIYSYKRVRQIWKGFFRNTFLGHSRAMSEWINLNRLGALGIPAPDPVAILEVRRFRVLRACALATRWVPAAETLDHFLFKSSPARVRQTLKQVAALVARMHRNGYTDGDLHLRNLMHSGEAPLKEGRIGQILKIDSPAGRYSWARRNQIHDLACLEVGGKRLLSAFDRLRFWIHYREALKEPSRTRNERARLAAILKRAESLESKEGPRIDGVLKSLQ